MLCFVCDWSTTSTTTCTTKLCGILYANVCYFFVQVQELRKYFKNLGAEISSEKSSKGVEDDLHKIIGVCDVCFKDGDPAQIDCILNSIVSIMITVSRHKLEIATKVTCLFIADFLGSWRKHNFGILRKNDQGPQCCIDQGVSSISLAIVQQFGYIVPIALSRLQSFGSSC